MTATSTRMTEILITRTTKKQLVQIGKTTALHVHHAFLYISFPSRHDYNVKMPNFTFCGGSEHKITAFFLFLTFDTVFYFNSTKNDTVNIWRIERDGINAIKYKAARLHFFKWLFPVVIALVVAHSSLTPTVYTHLSWTEGILSCRWDLCGSSR